MTLYVKYLLGSTVFIQGSRVCPRPVRWGPTIHHESFFVIEVTLLATLFYRFA